jgi:hypothetical protein
MRTIKLIGLLTVFIGLHAVSQAKLPIEFRAEKQAMSTPMSSLDEVIFVNYYYAKPVNIKFDGTVLLMNYDNGSTFVKKNVTEVNRDKEYDHDKLISETILYTDNTNVSDTISFMIDYNAGYVQIALPTKNSKGEYIGYTSYRKFAKENELAMK